MIFRKLNELIEASVSHDPAIKKKVMVKTGEVPPITQFARTVFKHGQIAPSHAHKDMYEIFYVEEGEGHLILNGKEYILSKNSCVVVAPGEHHEVSNRSDKPLILLVIGVRS